MVLNLGSIEPQGFVESLSGVRQGSRHTQYSPVHTSNVGPFLSAVKKLAADNLATHNFSNIYLCFEEIIFYFSNYEGFGECTGEACRVQYLQYG